MQLATANVTGPHSTSSGTLKFTVLAVVLGSGSSPQLCAGRRREELG
jgi:hypothetical protein